MENLIKNTI